MKKSWKERYREFREWQVRPFEVAAMSEEEHDCPTCHTLYKGNFCPRCGQSARIGRYSFTTALLNFLDVWGIGNRSMFRTLRDLILRPGYMIRDYLSGMQMAYFPPFQMLFLLTTLSFIILYGVNIRGITYEDLRQEALTQVEQIGGEDPVSTEAGAAAFNWIMDFTEQYPNLVSLLYIGIFSLFLFPFYRHNKVIPNMRYSEFMVATIYIANMISLYELVMMFFCCPVTITSIIASLTALIPLKQLSGFSWFRTILSIVGAFLALMAAYIILVGIVLLFLFFKPTL
ncbi:MAG: DUF3667 domain-containing protein [Bacteroidaceae bacterium]|nr:DUF3667 domain-containing protein [Bacteroidaceae bacterium]